MSTIDRYLTAALPDKFGVWIVPDGTVHFFDAHRHFDWLADNYDLFGISDDEFVEAVGEDYSLNEPEQLAYERGAIRLGMDSGELYAYTNDLNTAFIKEVQDFIFHYGASGRIVTIEGNNGSLQATFDDFITEKPGQLSRQIK